MKTIYLPTTTLNFTNIMSSESVSPKSFYSRREFGYKRWVSIAENSLENAIVLYDTKCSFIREKSDYEDHPLLIELRVSSEKFAKFKKIAEGIYLCDCTLYFNPWNTKFIFFSEEHRRVTLSRSDSSLESKLVKLYEKRMEVEHRPIQSYSFENGTQDLANFNRESIDIDKQINRMKGALHGYYIGALLSTTNDAVKKLNIYNKIHNVFSAIKSSIEKRATQNQEEVLTNLFQMLDRFSDYYSEIVHVIGDEKKADQVFAIIKKRGGYSEYSITNLLDDLLKNGVATEEKNPSIAWIETQKTHHERKMKSEISPLSPNESEWVVIDNRLSKVRNNFIKGDDEQKILVSWINEVLSSDKFNGGVSTFKEILSDEITIKAKEIYQGRWSDSPAYKFLNELRRHVRGDELKHDWDNSLFSSIASVITKGDDWEKMLKFMQTKGMTDYRLAFAMFGCLNGFANLTRDFTDILYMHNNRAYVAEVYKEFHGQLHGGDIIIEKQPEKFDNNRIDNPDSNISLPSKTQDNIEIQIKTVIRNKCKSEQAIEIFRKNNCKLNERFFTELSKIKGVGKVAVGKLKSILQYSPSTNISSPENQGLFEPPKPESEFYRDPNVYLILETLLPDDDEVRKQFKEDLDWLQDEYIKGPFSKYYANASRDNVAVIRSFERHLNKKKEQKKETKESKIERSNYAKIDIASLMKKLKDLYK